MDIQIPNNEDFLFVCSFLLWSFARVDGEIDSKEDAYLQDFIDRIPQSKRSTIINRIKSVNEDEVISIVKKMDRVETIHLITHIVQIITSDGKVLKSELKALKGLNDIIEGEWDLIKDILNKNHNIDVDTILEDSSIDKKNEIQIKPNEKDIIKEITCPECKSEINSISVFCSFCGFKLPEQFENTQTDLNENIYKDISESDKNDYLKKVKSVDVKKLYEIREKCINLIESEFYSKAIEVLNIMIDLIPTLNDKSLVMYSDEDSIQKIGDNYYGPINLDDLYLNRADCYFEQLDYQRAKEDYLFAYSLNSSHKCYHKLGVTNIKLGIYNNETVNYFNKSIELSTSNQDYDDDSRANDLFNRAAVYMQLKDFQNAINDLEEYRTIVSGDENAINLLEVCKSALKDNSTWESEIFIKEKIDIELFEKLKIYISGVDKLENIDLRECKKNLDIIDTWLNTYKTRKYMITDLISLPDLLYLRIQYQIITNEKTETVFDAICYLIAKYPNFEAEENSIGADLINEGKDLVLKKMRTCSKCQYINPIESKFCVDCGERIG